MIIRRTVKKLAIAVSVGLAFAFAIALLTAYPTTVYAQGRSTAPIVASAVEHSRWQADALLSTTNAYSIYLPIVYKPVPPPQPFQYIESFDDPACSGWPVRAFNPNDPFPPGPWVARCEKAAGWDPTNNVYGVNTVSAWNSWIYPAPVVLADPLNFTITVDGQPVQDGLWASSWGVYFNANADRTKFYTFQLYQDGVPDLNTSPTFGVRRWDDFHGTSDDDNVIVIQKRCKSCFNSTFSWNRVIIRRTGSAVTIYAGDAYYPPALYQPVAQIGLPDYTGAAYNGVGFYHGNFEFMYWSNNTAYQFDRLIIDPVLRVESSSPNP